MILFKLLGKGLGKLFKGLGYIGKYSYFLPAGIFIVSQFFWDLISTKSLPFALSSVAKTLFSAELVINEKVHMAIANVQGYNLIDVFQIIISLYILYALIRAFVQLQIGLGGSQAKLGAYMISVLIVGIIEVSAIKVIDGVWGFIPYWNGVIFLMLNIQPVFTSIFGYASTITTESLILLGSFFKRKAI